MDTRRAPVTDFSSNRGDVSISGDSSSAQHVIRCTKYIRVTGANSIGQPVFRLNLDVGIDPIVNEIAKGYERYQLKDAKLIMQSGSPLGTSSGGIQVAHVPDPDNANFAETTASYATNLEKVVRQSGSVFVRPRDSTVFPLHLDGTLYTKSAGSLRWSSYGTVIGIVRSVPDGADYCEWTMTLECTFVGVRSAIIDTIASLSYSTSIVDAKIADKKIIFGIHLDLPATRGVFTVERRILVKGRNKLGNVINVYDRELITFDALIDGREIIYTPLYEPLVFKSYVAGAVIHCTIPALADNVRLY